MDRRGRARQRRAAYQALARNAPLVDIPPTRAAALEARTIIRRLDPDLGERLDAVIPLEDVLIRELHSLRWILSRSERRDESAHVSTSVLDP